MSFDELSKEKGNGGAHGALEAQLQIDLANNIQAK